MRSYFKLGSLLVRSFFIPVAVILLEPKIKVRVGLLMDNLVKCGHLYFVSCSILLYLIIHPININSKNTLKKHKKTITPQPHSTTQQSPKPSSIQQSSKTPNKSHTNLQYPDHRPIPPTQHTAPIQIKLICNFMRIMYRDLGIGCFWSIVIVLFGLWFGLLVGPLFFIIVFLGIMFGLFWVNGNLIVLLYKLTGKLL